MLEALEGPYNEFIVSQSEDGRRQYVRVPVCLDEAEYQIISVIAYLEEFGDYHELAWGIHVIDVALDTQWINFERAKGRACLHNDIRPVVLDIAHSCCERVAMAVRPLHIYRKMAEPAPWGYRPERFDATTALLERCGYWLLPQYPRQSVTDGRWEWIHERV